MAGKRTTAKSSGAANGRSNGHRTKAAAGSALTQAPKAGKAAGSRRAQPSAYELGLRAWRTTYKNSRKSKAA